MIINHKLVVENVEVKNQKNPKDQKNQKNPRDVDQKEKRVVQKRKDH